MAGEAKGVVIGMTESPISVEFRPHVELHYRILSRLGLGEDAADLFRPRGQTPGWAGELLEAYRDAPGRLMLQVLPLVAADIHEELQLLEPGTLAAFADPAGRRLVELFAEILEVEAARELPVSTRPDRPSWCDTLAECRDHLWSRLDDGCPPLCIVDAPALADGEFTHGRATKTPQQRVVAVSLDAGRMAFVQVLHEEIHPVTDPVVERQSQEARRDTAPGSDGFELHRRLEQMAVEVGEALVEARAAEFLDDYRRWMRRYAGFSCSPGTE